VTLQFLQSDQSNEVIVPDPLCAQFYYSDIWLEDRGILIVSNSEKELFQKVLSDDQSARGLEEFSASVKIKHLINHAPLVSSIHDSIWSCPPNSLLLFGSDREGKIKNSQNPRVIFKSRFKEIYVDRQIFISELINQYQLKVKNKRVVHVFISAGFDSRLELALLMMTCERNCTIILHSFFEDEESTSVVRNIAHSLSLTLVMHDMKEQTQRGMEIKEIIESISESSNWRPTIAAYAGVIAENLGKDNDSDSELFFGFTPYEFKGRYFDLYGKYQGKRLRFISNLESSQDIQTRQLELQSRLLETYIKCSPFKEEYKTIDFLNWSLSYTNSYSHRNRILGRMGLINLTARKEIAQLFFNLPRAMKERNNLILDVINYLVPTLSSIPFISSSDSGQPARTQALKKRTTDSQIYIGLLNSFLSKRLSVMDSEVDLRMLDKSNWSESKKFNYLQVEYFKTESMRAMRDS
jgi:hypothetical protein